MVGGGRGDWRWMDGGVNRAQRWVVMMEVVIDGGW